jgi:hypothetical protein
MPHSNIIDGQSDDEVWKIIGHQLSSKDDNLDYTAEFTIHNRCINLDIDIHPDRGDENEKPVHHSVLRFPIKLALGLP